MVLIHDDMNRVTQCDPSGYVEEVVEGYEVYEHYEQIEVRVHEGMSGRDQVITVQMGHDDLPRFCAQYDRYRDAHLDRAIDRQRHVDAASGIHSVDAYRNYYNNHRIEMAALRVSLASFVDSCNERERRVYPMAS